MRSASSIPFPRIARTSTTAGIGSTQPNVIYNTGADITLTPSLGGDHPLRVFLQTYRTVVAGGNTVHVPRTRTTRISTTKRRRWPGNQSIERNNAAIEIREFHGWSNIGANPATVFDKWKRYSFNQDLAYFKGPGHAQSEVRILASARHQRRGQRL
jgi:hypothetical protein